MDTQPQAPPGQQAKPPVQEWLSPEKMEEIRRALQTECELKQVRLKGVVFVLKAPDAEEWRNAKVIGIDADPKVKVDSNIAIVNKCVVAPKADDLKRVLNRWPALVDSLALKLSEMAGSEEEIEEKK